MNFKKVYAYIISATLALSVVTYTNSTVEAISAVNANKTVSTAKNESKTKSQIKFLAHYDPFDSTYKDALKSYKEKYNNDVRWYPTTWDNRYTDLSTYVLGGEGIDLFLYDDRALPNGIVSGMFQPIDKYVDLNNKNWNKVKNVMDNFCFNGKHYNLLTFISSDAVVIYDQTTITKNRLADPYKLWQMGKWNWDTFQSILNEYVDTDKQHYGLDGWWSEKPLYLSAGMPAVSVSNGKLNNNLNSKKLEKAMNFCYDLYSDGLVLDKSEYDWEPQEHFMGEGKELFYICGIWTLMSDPAEWTTGLNPKNVRMVPVPSPKGSDNYMSVSVSGWCLCKGAMNPAGAVRLSEYQLNEYNNSKTDKYYDKVLKSDFKWNSKAIKAYDKINVEARKHPVVELASGSIDDYDLMLLYTSSDTVGLKSALHGVEWDQTKEEFGDLMDLILADTNNKLGKLK